MATHKLLLLPGDGIGPEVMGEVKRLIDWLNAQGIAHFETEQGLVGGSAYDAHKVSISEGDMAKATAADAVIFGAVGGPKWDAVPYEHRPEAGLLRLRDTRLGQDGNSGRACTLAVDRRARQYGLPQRCLAIPATAL